MKNVLVLAYYYPPLQRVGGRRWHLFAKYLQRLDINVTVITCDKDETLVDTTEVLLYVPDPGNSQLPYYKRKLPSSFFEKIIWKTSHLIDLFKIKWIDYDHYDLSIPVIGDYISQARQVLKSGEIDTVFLTVGPFSYGTILVDLKQEFPNVKFIIDYRDDWFRDRPKLTPRQLQGEMLRERNILNAVDLVTSVDANIISLIRRNHPGVHTPMIEIPHGYDADDFPNVTELDASNTDDQLRLVYGGACYLGVAKYYSLFRQFIESNPGLSIDFYFTFLAKDVQEVLKDLPGARMLPPVNRQQMLDIQRFQSDINLILYPDTNHSARSSKFYELIKCGKPIWYFGPDGDTAHFIRHHNLGLTFCKPNDIRVLQKDELRSFHINLSVLEENSIENITLRLQNAVENIESMQNEQSSIPAR